MIRVTQQVNVLLAVGVFVTDIRADARRSFSTSSNCSACAVDDEEMCHYHEIEKELRSRERSEEETVASFMHVSTSFVYISRVEFR